MGYCYCNRNRRPMAEEHLLLNALLRSDLMLYFWIFIYRTIFDPLNKFQLSERPFQNIGLLSFGNSTLVM